MSPRRASCVYLGPLSLCAAQLHDRAEFQRAGRSVPERINRRLVSREFDVELACVCSIRGSQALRDLRALAYNECRKFIKTLVMEGLQCLFRGPLLGACAACVVGGPAGNRTRVRRHSLAASTRIARDLMSLVGRPRAGSQHNYQLKISPSLGLRREGLARLMTPFGEFWRAPPSDGPLRVLGGEGERGACALVVRFCGFHRINEVVDTSARDFPDHAPVETYSGPIAEGKGTILRAQNQIKTMGNGDKIGLTELFDVLLGAILDPEQSNHLLDVADFDGGVDPLSMWSERKPVECFSVICHDPVVLALTCCPAGGACVQHRPHILEGDRTGR